jgi:hypothetical protein
MKTLVLHVGTYKTGTTSLQNSLYTNSTMLLENGVNYLGHKAGCSGHNGRQNFQTKMSNSELEIFLRNEPGDTHVFSNECLWDRQSARKKILPVVENSSIYSKVIVVAYVRKQSDFVESFYKQEQKYGSRWAMGLSPMSFYNELLKKGTLDIYGTLNYFAKLFGKKDIQVKCYNKENLHNGDVVDDFMGNTFMEVSGEDIIKPDRQNDSTLAGEALLKSVSTSLIQYMNNNTNLQLSPARKNILADDFLDQKYAAYKQYLPSLVFSEEERVMIARDFLHDNQKVSREYNVTGIL